MKQNNTSQIVSNLTQSFQQELKRHPNGRNNTKGTFAYAAQVDFMYAIDSITKGGPIEMEHGISQARRIISELRQKEV